MTSQIHSSSLKTPFLFFSFSFLLYKLFFIIEGLRNTLYTVKYKIWSVHFDKFWQTHTLQKNTFIKMENSPLPKMAIILISRTTSQWHPVTWMLCLASTQRHGSRLPRAILHVRSSLYQKFTVWARCSTCLWLLGTFTLSSLGFYEFDSILILLYKVFLWCIFFFLLNKFLKSTLLCCRMAEHVSFKKLLLSQKGSITLCIAQPGVTAWLFCILPSTLQCRACVSLLETQRTNQLALP